MFCTSTIRKHWLKYPLMWVMLLWAITLPGHEVMVYDYLVQGSVASAKLRLAPSQQAEPEAQSLKPQSVQAFPDADTAPVLVLKQVLPISRLLLLPQALALCYQAEPLYFSPVSAAELLARRIPFSLRPNAP